VKEESIPFPLGEGVLHPAPVPPPPTTTVALHSIVIVGAHELQKDVKNPPPPPPPAPSPAPPKPPPPPPAMTKNSTLDTSTTFLGHAPHFCA
jgi:hypothetical protein